VYSGSVHEFDDSKFGYLVCYRPIINFRLNSFDIHAAPDVKHTSARSQSIFMFAFLNQLNVIAYI